MASHCGVQRLILSACIHLNYSPRISAAGDAQPSQCQEIHYTLPLNIHAPSLSSILPDKTHTFPFQDRQPFSQFYNPCLPPPPLPIPQ